MEGLLFVHPARRLKHMLRPEMQDFPPPKRVKRVAGALRARIHMVASPLLSG